MPRSLLIAVFIGLALALGFGIHWYFWARLVRDTALPSPWRTLALGALIALGLLLPTPMILGRFSAQAARIVAWPAFVWMGLVLLLLLGLLGADLVRWAVVLLSSLGGVPLDPQRRLLLARFFGGAAAATATAFGALGVSNVLHPVARRDLEISLDRLPASFDGTTIVQLSDIHVGPTIGRDFLTELVRRTNALEPDIVAITGDLVDGPVADLAHHIAPLAELRARYGVFFVTGNHEYYSGADEWIAELQRLGIRVLRNERVSVGSGADRFDLAGIDDYHSTGMAEGHGPDLPRALAGRDPARELVLLAHQPIAVLEASRHGVGLQLSGHTHGGQIWPWGYFVRLQQPYIVGLARHGATQIYVSPGTGYWGPPMRLGTRGELTRIVLRTRSVS